MYKETVEVTNKILKTEYEIEDLILDALPSWIVHVRLVKTEADIKLEEEQKRLMELRVGE